MTDDDIYFNYIFDSIMKEKMYLGLFQESLIEINKTPPCNIFNYKFHCEKINLYYSQLRHFQRILNKTCMVRLDIIYFETKKTQ